VWVRRGGGGSIWGGGKRRQTEESPVLTCTLIGIISVYTYLCVIWFVIPAQEYSL
jgi:hypothetical protein